ncbi:MAG: PQQ-binding-like beta-propeller repeat protein [Coleofasciculus sp. D1-CHI-01]|uniref:outer membrane protein assembly factor BamB family protein n=1 Tax=Coleofasciculus sp. D1-CHI-01 TaxID=3068482 RepID=UPI0032F288FB
MLLFIGNLCWKNPPLEQCWIKVESGLLPWVVSSSQGFMVLGKRKKNVTVLSSFDLREGCQLWTKTFNSSLMSISVCRDERLLVTQDDRILILERNQVRSVLTGVLYSGVSPCLTDNGQQVVAVKASGDLVAWDLNGHQQWQWTPLEKQSLASPIPQSDGSVILVVSSVELCRVVPPGLVLDKWVIGANTRLYIDGRLGDDQLLVQSTSIGFHPNLLLLSLEYRELYNLGNLVVIYPHGDAATPYLANVSTGKITTVARSGLVDKLRSPNPKFCRFISLPPNCIGIYGNLKSGVIVAADAQGKKLWNITLPQKHLNWSFLAFGSQHLVLSKNDGILVLSPIL